MIIGRAEDVVGTQITAGAAIVTTDLRHRLPASTAGAVLALVIAMHPTLLAQAALLICCVLLPTHVKADEPPTTDFAASYVFVSNIGYGNSYPAGWLAAVTWYPNEWFGVVGEVGGSYKSDALPGALPALSGSIYNFMGGAKAVRRGSAAMPFAQALFGPIRAGNNYGGYQRDFASQFGGGVDLRVVGGFGVRAQADYRVITAGGQCCIKELRVAAGVLLMR